MNSHLTISHEDPDHLPIQLFDLIIIVEPDQEKWMPDFQDQDEKQPAWGEHIEMIECELDSDLPRKTIAVEYDHLKENKFVWMPWALQGEGLYGDWAIEYCDMLFRFHNPDEIPGDLKIYLEALYKISPQQKIALIGGMFEDEIEMVAQFTAEIGFDTTVLARYCLSGNAFVDLDNLSEQMSTWFQENKRPIDYDPSDDEDDE